MKIYLLTILLSATAFFNAQNIPIPYPQNSASDCEKMVNNLIRIANNASSCKDIEAYTKQFNDINDNGCVASWGFANSTDKLYITKSAKKIEQVVITGKCGKSGTENAKSGNATVSAQDFKNAVLKGSFDDKRMVLKKFFEEQGFTYKKQGPSTLVFVEGDDSLNEKAYTLDFENFKIIIDSDGSVGIYTSKHDNENVFRKAMSYFKNNFELGGVGDEAGSAWYVLDE